MRKLLLFILAAFVFTACEKKTTETANPDAEKEIRLNPVEAVDNQLSEEQKNDGWILLFDGKSKAGWRTFKNKENNSWEVVDGTLHCKAFEIKGSEKRADLITEGQYENFELSFDWKVQKQSNSGVMFRVTENFEEPHASGPEYQILDDLAYTDVQETNFTGCLYAMYPVAKKKLNAVGDWNQSKIVSKGNHIEHWLNGEKVLTYEINSADWNNAKASGKWKDFPGYGKSPKGHIDLQDHGNEVWFKNMMIKPI
jgi:hypothetical protein